MTWDEAKVELQMASEERVGAVIRMYQRLAKEREDAAMKSALEAVGGRG